MLMRLVGRGRGADLASEVEQLASENAELRATVALLEQQVAETAELRATIAVLEPQVAENAELRATVALLEQQMADLKHQIEVLTAKLAADSRNSSKPPSSDGPAAPPRRRKKGSRKRGGQPGHEGTTRAMVPVEHVNEVVDCRPTCCEACDALLLGEDPAPERRQVIDIPKPTIIVREYRIHRLACLACGRVTAGELPAGLSDSVFGVGLHTLAAILVGRFRQSKRLVVELFEILYDLSISPGSICAMERRVAAALETPVAEARAALRSERVVGKDETGWRHMKNKASVGDGDGASGRVHHRPSPRQCRRQADTGRVVRRCSVL